jgi:hypothetical protein
MVGWFKRHTCRGPGGQLRYTFTSVTDYSIILTKAAVMHQKYLHAYSNSQPQWIRDFVKENRNGEDIAMQFLVSNATGKPPWHIDVAGVQRCVNCAAWCIKRRSSTTRNVVSFLCCAGILIEMHTGRHTLARNTTTHYADARVKCLKCHFRTGMRGGACCRLKAGADEGKAISHGQGHMQKRSEFVSLLQRHYGMRLPVRTSSGSIVQDPKRTMRPCH